MIRVIRLLIATRHILKKDLSLIGSLWRIILNHYHIAIESKNYDFYPRSRKPAIVSLSDENDEESPVDYDEIPDDDA